MSHADTPHVLSWGAVTAVGVDAPSSAASIRAGIAGMGEHPTLLDRSGEPVVVASAPTLDPDFDRPGRVGTLAAHAAAEALAALDGIERTGLHVFVGVAEPRPGRPQNIGSEVRRALQSLLPDAGKIAVYEEGNAAGFVALEHGLAALRADRSVCLVGGVDSLLATETLAWLESGNQLHSPTNGWGLCPGEAAGFCILGSEGIAQRLDTRPGVRVLAVATANEPNRIKTNTVCVGAGLTDVLRDVVARVPTGQTLRHVICDMNGEPYRADEFGFAMLRTSPHFDPVADFETPADCWGDVGAASLPLFLILKCEAVRRSYAEEQLTLLLGSSENGRRGAAVVERTYGDH